MYVAIQWGYNNDCTIMVAIVTKILTIKQLNLED